MKFYWQKWATGINTHTHTHTHTPHTTHTHTHTWYSGILDARSDFHWHSCSEKLLEEMSQVKVHFARLLVHPCTCTRIHSLLLPLIHISIVSTIFTNNCTHNYCMHSVASLSYRCEGFIARESEGFMLPWAVSTASLNCNYCRIW